MIKPIQQELLIESFKKRRRQEVTYYPVLTLSSLLASITKDKDAFSEVGT